MQKLYQLCFHINVLTVSVFVKLLVMVVKFMSQFKTSVVNQTNLKTIHVDF